VARVGNFWGMLMSHPNDEAHIRTFEEYIVADVGNCDGVAHGARKRRASSVSTDEEELQVAIHGGDPVDLSLLIR
jgi:hypothetical protein